MRCIVQTVKNAPTTSAEMPNSMPTMSSSEPISDRNELIAMSESTVPFTVVEVWVASSSSSA